MTGLLNSPDKPLPDKVYVFSVDFSVKVNIDGLFEYLRVAQAARTITGWSYISFGLFLLTSRHNAFELSESLHRVLGDIRCIVIEANPHNAGGWLPLDAWNWLASKKPPQGALAFVPPPPKQLK